MDVRARVLVVDDGAGVLSRALGDALAGHEVEVARGVVDALYRIDCAPAWFDVIFCDLGRGDMPGPELWAYLSLDRTHVARRIVFVATSPLTQAACDFLERVPNPCVEPPFDTESLHMLAVRRARSTPPDPIPA